MIRKYQHWYNSLTPFKKLVLSFTVNWLYWFAANRLWEEFVNDENRGWRYSLFQATWMAVWMTIFFNWGTVKALFKK